MESLQRANAAADNLISILHPSDRPSWLTTLRDQLSEAIQHSNNTNSVDPILTIANLKPQLDRHKWDMESLESHQAFDFDEIFERHRAESKIPELFEAVIDCLEQIVASGHVDSVSMVCELEEVIATLKKSKNGSYFSWRNGWIFFRAWMHNAKWEYLFKTPLLGPLMKSLHQTIKDCDAGMVKVEEETHEEIENKLSVEFPKLAYEPIALPAPPDSDDVIEGQIVSKQ